MPHTYVGRTEGANNYSAADPTITFSSARSPFTPIAEGIELIEPQLLMLGEQALILRGYERLRNDEGPFTVLQEWQCEPA